MVIKKEESLRQILQFYYGLQCAFAHGSSQMMFKQGVLANFPCGDSAIKLIVEQETGEVCESAIKTVRKLFIDYEKLKQIEWMQILDYATCRQSSMCELFDHHHDQLAKSSNGTDISQNRLTPVTNNLSNDAHTVHD